MLAIIIINRNDFDNTTECLDSIFANVTKDFSVILIDNWSTDWSKEKLMEKYSFQSVAPSNWKCEQYDVLSPDISFNWHQNKNILIELNDNYWFTWANNYWFKFAYQNWYTHFLLLNNDTVVSKTFCNDILSTAAHYPQHIIWTKIVYHHNPKKIRFLWAKINWLWVPESKWYNKQDTYNGEKMLPSELISWCTLLISKNILEVTGWQDNNYFFNIDDSDYSFWAKKKGHPWIINTEISVLHKTGESVKDKPNILFYYNYRNLFYFRRKYFSLSKNIISYIFLSYRIIRSRAVNLILWKKNQNIYYKTIKDIYTWKLWKHS